MSSQYGYINLLSQEDVSKTLGIIDSLSDKWIRRGPVNTRHDFYTLGAVSHLDIPSDVIATEKHIDFINKNNKILLDNFKYLYDIVIDKVSEMFGPCELVDDVPFPGFYIFGDIEQGEEGSISPYGDVAGLATIHSDGLFPMLDYKWEKYGGATDSFAVTVAIQLPKNGAGVLIWDQPDIGFYSNSEYAKACKQFDFSKNPDNDKFIKKNIKDPIPDVIEYGPGGMFWHNCGIYHALGYSVNTLTTDRRITMQIFGIKCDGVWRLVF
jgi:hypothetical protein